MNHAAGNAEFPIAHAINNHLSLMSSLGAGFREYPLRWLYGMAWAFTRQDNLTVGNFANLYYGHHDLDLAPLITAIENAFMQGFTVGGLVIAPGSSIQEIGAMFVRHAAVWAKSNKGLLRVLLVVDLIAIAALPGGAAVNNHPRLQINYDTLASEGTYLGVVEALCLGNHLFSNASRMAGSAWDKVFTAIVEFHNTPAPMLQPGRVANSLNTSGLEVDLLCYSDQPGLLTSLVDLRLNYTGGTVQARKAGFTVMLPVVLTKFVTLRVFMQPYSSVYDASEAYTSLVSELKAPNAALPHSSRFYRLTSIAALDAALGTYLAVPAQQATLLPPGDCLAIAQATLAVYRNTLTVASSSSSVTVGGAGGMGSATGAAYQAGSEYKNRVVNQLMKPGTVYGVFEVGVNAAVAMAPNNPFPILVAAGLSRNPVLMQVMTGRFIGLANLSTALLKLEEASREFGNFVDEMICQVAPPVGGASSRPSHTIGFVFDRTFIAGFLGDELAKFSSLPFLQMSAVIHKIRANLFQAPTFNTASMFLDGSALIELKQLQPFLDSFNYLKTGPGSWVDALDLLEAYRALGSGLGGNALADHCKSCQELWLTLLKDFHESVRTFAHAKEHYDVVTGVSGRVFEAGGDFTRMLAFKQSQQVQVNSLMLMMPSFQALLNAQGSSSVTPPKPPKVEKTGEKPKPKGDKVICRLNGKGAEAQIVFGSGASAVTYSVSHCMEKVKVVLPTAKLGTFCLAFYLSTTGVCMGKHGKSHASHTFSVGLKAMRPDFEHSPYRTDAKAKAAQ